MIKITFVIWRKNISSLTGLWALLKEIHVFNRTIVKNYFKFTSYRLLAY
jgi:hypothetical protein